jgi:DNA-binding PadR family transcriptional regulator
MHMRENGSNEQPVQRLPGCFLRPCLLLLLKEQPDYGYDLVSRLPTLGIEVDSPTVYRALRALEDSGAVASHWNRESTGGPARKMYRLTTKGDRLLDESLPIFDTTQQAIAGFLCRYASVAPPSGQPNFAGREASPRA